MKPRGKPIAYLDEIITQPQLGSGIYTIPDISRILRLPQSKVRVWLNDYWNSRFVPNRKRKYSWGEGRDRAVSFYALIEFYTFFQLRKYGVSAQKATRAHESISKYLKTPYPFASSKILTDGSSVLFSTEANILINADSTFQLNLKRIVEQFCAKIDFGEDFLAQKFFPIGKENSVVIDPHHQFGQPTIYRTNIPAETLFNYYKGGEKVGFIATLYELSEKEVRDAIAFYSEAA